MEPKQQLSVSDNHTAGDETKPYTIFYFQKMVTMFMIHTHIGLRQIFINLRASLLTKIFMEEFVLTIFSTII